MFNPSRILILAPHTDDGELGCGGTIAKFSGSEKEVFYAAFCLCSKALPKTFPSKTLELECQKATSILGIPPSRLILFNYEVRELPQFRQQILEELLKLNKDIHPEMVLLPAACGNWSTAPVTAPSCPDARPEPVQEHDLRRLWITME